jgi:hypothetical protein
LPREYNFEVQKVEVPEGQTAGEISIAIPHNAAGNFTFCLAGIADVSYVRNPEAAKAAAERKAAIEKLAAELDAKAKQSPDNAEAQAKAKQMAEFLQSFGKKVTDLENAAKPAPVRVASPTGSIVLNVTAAPIAIESAAPVAPLVAGTNGELLVKVRRLYGFNDPVPLKLNLPGGVKGIQIPAGQIEKDQTEIKLPIQLAADATAGSHKVALQASPNVRGQALPVNQEITLTIEKPAPPK